MSTIVTWASMLKDCDPSRPNHLWFREVGQEGNKVQFETMDERSKKMPLKRLVEVSTKMTKDWLWSYNSSRRLAAAKQNFSGIGLNVFFDNVFDVDFKMDVFFQKLDSEVQTDIDATKLPGQIYESLEKMCKHARLKRQQEATKSIWNKIIYFFWSLFHDPTHLLVKPEAIIAPEAQQLKKEKLDSMCRSFKSRIGINVEIVEEELKVSPKREVKFKTVKEAKLWYMKYGPDKYQNVTPLAEEARRRVRILYELWDECLKRMPQPAA